MGIPDTWKEIYNITLKKWKNIMSILAISGRKGVGKLVF